MKFYQFFIISLCYYVTVFSTSDAQISTSGLPVAVPINRDFTVIEGNTINVSCAIIGEATRVAWKFISPNGVERILVNGTDNRVVMKHFRGVPEATILIYDANSTLNRGRYNCTAISSLGNSSVDGSSFVRIKSKYAALVPFSGICAQVIILCTILFIYEKKQDKTKSKGSDDTDQGPEMKTSPDRGPDQSTARVVKSNQQVVPAKRRVRVVPAVPARGVGYKVAT